MATRLRNLAIHARNLLDCDQASLCLYCPETALRHPLLALFHTMRKRATLCYGSSLALQDEHVRTLCAMALQSGCRINRGDLPRDGGSVAVAVLERPAGVLGFLLCVSSEPGAFQLGECRLLAQYLPELARQVELALSGTVETTCTPVDAVPTNTQYLNVIMEQTSHLEVLIGDVLDVSRIQSGRLALHYARVDLARLCSSVAQLMQSRADQQQPGRYSVLCRIEPALPLAWADADRVQQVLANLVENAIKYSPAGGLIEIHASLYPDEQYAETAREQTYRRTRDATCIYVTVLDSGIGLYIAHRLVEAMHGRLTLRSRARARERALRSPCPLPEYGNSRENLKNPESFSSTLAR